MSIFQINIAILQKAFLFLIMCICVCLYMHTWTRVLVPPKARDTDLLKLQAVVSFLDTKFRSFGRPECIFNCWVTSPTPVKRLWVTNVYHLFIQLHFKWFYPIQTGSQNTHLTEKYIRMVKKKRWMYVATWSQQKIEQLLWGHPWSTYPRQLSKASKSMLTYRHSNAKEVPI